MKLKIKFAETAHQLATGQLSAQQPQLAQMLSWFLNFTIGFIMSAIPVLSGCGPFGIAIVAQSGAQIAGLMCTFGASIGYLSFFGFEEGIKYVAAVVLVFTASYVFQELRIYKSFYFMPTVAAIFTLITGILGNLSSVNGESLVLPIITRTLLAGGATYFFSEAFDTSERDTESAELRHGIAQIILLACLLMAVSGAEIAGVLSIGRMISVIIIMAAAYKGGALTGVAAGIALGIAMDISSGQPPYYAMAFAFSGLISGVFHRHGRLMFLLTFILSGALIVAVNINTDARIGLLYENFAACVIFMLLPPGLINFFGAVLKNVNAGTGEAGLRKYAARRIGKMSEAFQDLYITIDSTLSADVNDEDVSKVFDRASEIVCSRCKNKSECWNKNYIDTLAAFNDVTPHIKNRGSIVKSDIPEHFAGNCIKLDELVSAVNGELRGQMYRRQFHARISENRCAAYSQYSDIAQILGGVADELQNSYGPDILAQRRLSRYLSSMDIEADISVFRDKGGRMHIIIESTKLKNLLMEPSYLNKLSAAVGIRLCRPKDVDAGIEGRISLMEAEPYAVSVGIASMKKKGEAVSGDRGTYFKTDQGVLCILLSDGMGSGESAAKESSAVIRILERFLRSGVDPAIGMKMLNSMMLLKNNDEWGFATVDLMCIDLFTGETVFYKYGAAPSYVRSGKSVKRIRSESLAAGLTAGENSVPDIVRLRLKPGNIALVASDGVLAGTNDVWVRNLISEYEGTDTKALAKNALQEALRQYGCSDDMTVLAVRLENRE